MKKYKELTPEEKKKLVASGYAAGGILSTIGTGAMIGKKYLEKEIAKLTPEQKIELMKKSNKYTEDRLRNIGKTGKIAAGIGAGTIAASGYLHYKNKKDKKKDDSNKE